MTVVVLTNPKTPKPHAEYIASVLVEFAKNIGREVVVKKYLTYNGLPKGQVFVTGENETWVKNLQGVPVRGDSQHAGVK
jgi:hypothetical protein